MEIKNTKFKDAFLITPDVFQDERGFFMEPYSEKKFAKLGIEANWVLDCHSMSVTKGVLRGLHFQKPPHTQAKLVRCTKGAVYDVIVDLRKDSPTFGQWEGFELRDDNFLMLYVPRGFAHGFCTLTDYAEFQYKCDNHYMPESEGGIIWNDQTIKAYWPVENPILSEKDKKQSEFKNFNSPF